VNAFNVVLHCRDHMLHIDGILRDSHISKAKCKGHVSHTSCAKYIGLRLCYPCAPSMLSCRP
jgi:hypothetical protein